jgi:hypothetical protein
VSFVSVTQQFNTIEAAKLEITAKDATCWQDSNHQPNDYFLAVAVMNIAVPWARTLVLYLRVFEKIGTPLV